MKFLVGTKLNMVQMFEATGEASAATVIKVTPLTISQIKTKATDGYSAIQFGFGQKKPSLINKAQRGHAGSLGDFRGFREHRLADEKTEAKVGDKIDVGIFKTGDVVRVAAVTKGKGFQGVVKRHGFKGGSRTHGQKHSEREPGAIGGGARAGGRVAKGMRMAGRMGGDRVTVKNLKVLQVDPADNLIVVSGAVPGRRGTIVEILG